MKLLVYPQSHEIYDLIFCSKEESCDFAQAIFAASSKQKTTDMVRVKSSNVFSMKYDPRDNRIGDVYVQFKDPNTGGPGDVYCYYDVPARVYNRIVVAPSKGHMIYTLLKRNKFKYAKLTGDKRTHYSWGINYTPSRKLHT